MKPRPTPEVCPACGEDVPPKAKACPQCGACHESGWSVDADTGEADIPEYGYGDEQKFDYEGWRAREEGRARTPGLHPVWKWTALLLLAAMFWVFWKWIFKVGSTPWF